MLPTTHESELVLPHHKTRAKSWAAFDTAVAGARSLCGAPMTHASPPMADSTSDRGSLPLPPGMATVAPTFRCLEPDCFRKFNRRYTLVEHMKTHSGEKPHMCPAAGCRKRFSTSGNLSRHKRLHGFIQPLECPVAGCPSTFASNNKLEKHMQYHLGSPVHVCKIGTCGKTFSTTGNLNRHIKHHHPYESSQHESNLSNGSFTSTSSSRSRGSSAPPAHQSFQSPTAADDLYNASASGNSSSSVVLDRRDREQHAQRLLDDAATVFPRIHPASASAGGSDTLFDSLATILNDDAVLGPSGVAPHAEQIPHQAYSFQQQHRHHYRSNSHAEPYYLATAMHESEYLQKASLLDDMVYFHVANFQC